MVEEIKSVAPSTATLYNEVGEDDLLHGLNVDEWLDLEMQNFSDK